MGRQNDGIGLGLTFSDLSDSGTSNGDGWETIVEAFRHSSHPNDAVRSRSAVLLRELMEQHVDLGPAAPGCSDHEPQTSAVQGFCSQLLRLLIFVVVLVILNLLLGEMDWGIHISILGSLVITLVVWGIMGAGAVPPAAVEVRCCCQPSIVAAGGRFPRR